MILVPDHATPGSLRKCLFHGLYDCFRKLRILGANVRYGISTKAFVMSFPFSVPFFLPGRGEVKFCYKRLDTVKLTIPSLVYLAHAYGYITIKGCKCYMLGSGHQLRGGGMVVTKREDRVGGK